MLISRCIGRNTQAGNGNIGRMGWVGRGLTVFGVIVMVLPVVAGVLTLTTDVHLAFVFNRIPSIVLMGILLFVVGIAVQTLTER